MKGQTIQFRHCETGKKPALVVAVDTDDVQHLVMPVRLPGQ
jgi:DNA polymerase III sliding clamp (beta) subunit (PCNA family)